MPEKKKYSTEETEAFIKLLKARMTKSEKVLRRALIDAGIRMRSQCSLHGYIADFYSVRAKLVVEVDGSYHDRKGGLDYDAVRDCELFSHGIQTLRFRNEAVENETKSVIAAIRAAIEVRMPPKKQGRAKIMRDAMEHLNIRDRW